MEAQPFFEFLDVRFTGDILSQEIVPLQLKVVHILDEALQLADIVVQTEGTREAGSSVGHVGRGHRLLKKNVIRASGYPYHSRVGVVLMVGGVVVGRGHLPVLGGCLQTDVSADHSSVHRSISRGDSGCVLLRGRGTPVVGNGAVSSERTRSTRRAALGISL